MTIKRLLELWYHFKTTGCLRIGNVYCHWTVHIRPIPILGKLWVHMEGKTYYGSFWRVVKEWWKENIILFK